MTLRSLRARLTHIKTFVGAAASLTAIPALAIAGVARDNPFGHEGTLSSALGKWFGIIKIRTRATRGEWAFVDTHDLGSLISCEELLVEQTYDLSLVTFEPDLIVDCGSHIGLFSLVAGLRYPEARLIVYEPHPANFRLAEKQLDRFAPRLRLVEAAVSTFVGRAGFSSVESNIGHLDAEDTRLLVQTVDLPTEALAWNCKKLLIKIDIEGEERRVIPGLIKYLPTHCALFFEAHGGPTLWRELSDLFTHAGFVVTITRSRGIFLDGFALRVSE